MNKLYSNVIKAWLVVGTLDILSAFINFYIKTNNNPLTILKVIASGIVGKDAFEGGAGMLLLGLLLHYIIAFSFTIFFYWLFPKVKFFLTQKIATGIFYGMFIWGIMNLIVVPLSQVQGRTFTVSGVLTGMSILIVCIGIPLSLIANKFFSEKK